MSHPCEATPEANPEVNPEVNADSPPTDSAASHDFEVQKRIHQTIRNDPDYDDWEYGTEPLPHEAWVEPKAVQGSDPTHGAA